jgi:recombination protein RecA
MSDLDKRILAVKAKYGKKVVQTTNEVVEDTIIPTDIYEFDKASEVGGCPLGKIIEMAGPPSSGKTTLSWQLAGILAKKTGKKILHFDWEMNFSKKWVTKLGVPLDKIILALPEQASKTKDESEKKNLLSIEDGFNIMDMLLESQEFCAVIWDSVAASNPAALLNSVDVKGLDGKDVALKALALDKCLSVCAPFYRKWMTTVFFINHKRANMENMANPFLAKFADKEKTPGGMAFKHHADMRIDLVGTDFIKKQATNSAGKSIKVKIGQNVKIKFIKNRVGDPFGEETLVMRKGIGFDIVSSIIKKAVANGIIVRLAKGPTYLKDDENIKAPSYEGFWNLVYANPQLVEKIKAKLGGGDHIIGNIDLTAGTRELTVKELIGEDKLESDDDSEAPNNEVPIDPEVSEVEVASLDSLLDEKSNIELKSDTLSEIKNSIPLVVNAPAEEGLVQELTKRKRGRPPKVKV